MEISTGSIPCYKYVFNGEKGKKAQFGHDGIRPITGINGFEDIRILDGVECLITVYVYNKERFSLTPIGRFLANGITETTQQEAIKIKKGLAK